MTSQPDFIQPPRSAVWLLGLFNPALLAPNEEEEAILGDMLEEFSLLASESGAAVARRWYWRQVLKTIAHLVVHAFRTSPWSTSAAVIGGFLLRWLAAGLPERAIFAVLERYQVFDHHFGIYLFFASTGIDIGHIIVFLFVGCAVALAAGKREMAATMTLGLIYLAMALVAASVWMASGHNSLLWRLSWSFADSCAILVGGAIVRTRRSSTTPLHRYPASRL
jgi:hypothetical protein